MPNANREKRGWEIGTWDKLRMRVAHIPLPNAIDNIRRERAGATWESWDTFMNESGTNPIR